MSCAHTCGSNFSLTCARGFARKTGQTSRGRWRGGGASPAAPHTSGERRHHVGGPFTSPYSAAVHAPGDSSAGSSSEACPRGLSLGAVSGYALPTRARFRPRVGLGTPRARTCVEATGSHECRRSGHRLSISAAALGRAYERRVRCGTAHDLSGAGNARRADQDLEMSA